MRKALNFLRGLIIGGVVGAAIAILLAPTSGEEIRARFQERSIELKDEVVAVAGARRAELERELAALRAPAKKK